MSIKMYEEITKKDWYQTIHLILLFIVVMGLFSALLLPGYWYLWFLLVVIGVASLSAWHAKNFAYRCAKCNTIFEVSTLEDFLGPNGVKKKYLRCPGCGKRAWNEILRSK
jgi:DNA-directed RNA polymerase subunit RPC12/RpoP